MKRTIFFSLLLSIVGTVILLIGAGMAGGACHCMTPMFTLFPYGSLVAERTSWETFGFLLLLVQFPIYVTVVTMTKNFNRRIVSVVLIVALHIVAAAFGYSD